MSDRASNGNQLDRGYRRLANDVLPFRIGWRQRDYRSSSRQTDAPPRRRYQVMTTSYVSASTFYYDCYIGNQIPYYTGSADAMAVITSCELSDYMQMSGTGAMNADDVFDVFYVNGVLCIPTNGSGAGWSGDAGGSTGGRGTGYSAIHQTRGYWTNTNSISHCYNSTAETGRCLRIRRPTSALFLVLGVPLGTSA